MCGIAGIINFSSKRVEDFEIRKMMKIMKHRGPNDEGSFVDNNVGLGFVRLSILDLSSSGHQPMFSEDNRYVIVFNGEVYNYIELKDKLSGKYSFKSNTDTEVVLNSFLEWGEDCLNKFNGMFSFVIYDTLSKDVFIARDRYGIKPFYYFLDENRFIFASEIKSILPFISVKSINNKIMFDYLVYNRTDHSNNTFFNKIQKLQHGNLINIIKNKFEIKNWYNLYNRVINRKINITPVDYKEILEDSIKLRLRSDVKIGVSLSGGLDSSAITSILLNKFNLYDINSFSSTYNSNKSYDEGAFIKLYSSKIKNMHYVHPNKETFLNDYQDFILTHSEPVNDVGSYIQYKVMQLVSKHVTVVLDGQGADEQLGGYHNFYGSYYKELLHKGKISKLFREMFFYLKYHNSAEAYKYFLYYLLPPKLKEHQSKVLYGSISKNYFNSNFKQSSIVNDIYNPASLKESLIQHFEYKLEHLLKWDDLNSMRFSVESRIPFLDFRLVETSLSLSSENIIKDGVTKRILRDSMKKILPEKIRMRYDKKGFSSPRREWFCDNKVQDLIFDIIKSQDFNNLGFFDIKDVNKKYKLHLQGKGDFSKDIWKWINVYEWNKNIVCK